VYTGLAITSKASENFLFAADNANNKVDVYDGSFHLVTSLQIPRSPSALHLSVSGTSKACCTSPLPARQEPPGVSLTSSASMGCS
jgi:hypothetical protein